LPHLDRQVRWALGEGSKAAPAGAAEPFRFWKLPHEQQILDGDLRESKFRPN
jgi:hypothetical protein